MSVMMNYSQDEVLQYTREEDVKFIRLAYCDVFGRQKNISIMADELPRAFEHGISFDASAIAGFGDEERSDLLLHPEAQTLMPLPWRPEHGCVVQMFSSITLPDGKPFNCDSRQILKDAVMEADKAGYSFRFGPELEFYLFQKDENGRATKIPCDEAGYMDIAPDDKGENVRREICLTLEKMGILPERSHHEEGPGQNEIDFKYSDALVAADNAMTFQRVVKTIANNNGLVADFSPKPLAHYPGNGFHINMSIKALPSEEVFSEMIAGILANAKDMTAFMNPSEASYQRLGSHKAPRYVSWSRENRSPLVRIPAAVGEYRRVELRSPDPTANPYIAFALMIHASLYGIRNRLQLCEPTDMNLFTADSDELASFDRLPESFAEACRLAVSSSFIKEHMPSEILSIYCMR